MSARLRLLFLFLAFLSAALYLGVGGAGGVWGFPLDDAWIHQTYARNLAQRGEFAFLPGQPSAGSTAPLWTALLAAGYGLRVEPRAWAYFLGALALALNAGLTFRLVSQFWPERRAAAAAAGVAVALEWHLAWAAVSGMETVWFTALALLVFGLPAGRPALLGACVGVSVLVRPDGLTLLPFALARGILAGDGRREAGRALMAGAAGFLAVFLPYLGFNLAVGGALWPTTFYAKQAEYAAMRDLPLWWRAGTVSLQPVIGAQVLALPGLAAAGWLAGRRRQWELLLPLGWLLVFLGAYVWRLPVTYQYGRYVMPVIPVVIALGAGGLAELLRPRSPRPAVRVFSRAWVAAAGLLSLIFWGWGAVLYGRDVGIIETEMVAAARWINTHTPDRAVIAAHDIGALGYFGGRPVLDLAGLAAPDVIPFIRDEAQLGVWLTRAGADYLLTFPGWYPELVRPLADQVVYRSAGLLSPAAGGENLVLYRWP